MEDKGGLIIFCIAVVSLPFCTIPMPLTWLPNHGFACLNSFWAILIVLIIFGILFLLSPINS